MNTQEFDLLVPKNIDGVAKGDLVGRFEGLLICGEMLQVHCDEVVILWQSGFSTVSTLSELAHRYEIYVSGDRQ